MHKFHPSLNNLTRSVQEWTCHKVDTTYPGDREDHPLASQQVPVEKIPRTSSLAPVAATWRVQLLNPDACTQRTVGRAPASHRLS